MSADEFDQGRFELIGKVNDQAILVSADVEDHPVVAHEVYVRSKRCFYVRGSAPRAFRNDLIPVPERSLGLRVLCPESLKRPPGDDIRSHTMFPNWDQSEFPDWEHGKIGKITAEDNGLLSATGFGRLNGGARCVPLSDDHARRRDNISVT